LIDYIHTSIGFDHVPGGEIYNNRSVFSFHIYCGLVNRKGEPSNDLLCEAIEDWYYLGYIQDYMRIGGGGFLTEWGAMPQNTIDISSINLMCDL